MGVAFCLKKGKLKKTDNKKKSPLPCEWRGAFLCKNILLFGFFQADNGLEGQQGELIVGTGKLLIIVQEKLLDGTGKLARVTAHISENMEALAV